MKPMMIALLLMLSSPALAATNFDVSGLSLRTVTTIVADSYAVPLDEAKVEIISGAAALPDFEKHAGVKGELEIVANWLRAPQSKALRVSLPNGVVAIAALAPDGMRVLDVEGAVNNMFLVEIENGSQLCVGELSCRPAERCKGPDCPRCKGFRPEFLLDRTPLQYLPLGRINLFQKLVVVPVAE